MISLFELHHLFVAVKPGAPEVDRLTQAGFAEGSPNVHPGQGTACRRIFFDNAYLEFIWLADLSEASSPVVERTGLAHRAGGTGEASRLGFCLGATEPGAEPPVATWAYRPAYLPEGYSLPVAVNSSNLAEPLLFFLPAGEGAPTRKDPHPNGATRITSVVATLPDLTDPSPEVRWLAESGCVRIERGESETLAVEVDHGAQGRVLELDTPTSIELRW